MDALAPARPPCEQENLDDTRRWSVTMALMPFVAALAVGLGAVWVTGDASVFDVVGIIAAMIGTGLVGYFSWRAKFRRRNLSATDDERRAA